MRPQIFQAFVPLHAAQMGAPPVFFGNGNQAFSSTIPNESHLVYPFSFVYPSNAPGGESCLRPHFLTHGHSFSLVSYCQADMDIVMENVFSHMEDVFPHDMDVDLAEFHSSCAFIFPEPMDVDPLSIYSNDEPMDVDTPPAVLELSTLFDALALADSSTMGPDAYADSDSHRDPDHLAVVLHDPGNQAVILYNHQNNAVVLYRHHDKAVVLHNRNRGGLETLLDCPSTMEGSTNSPADEYEFNQLTKKFSQLAIREDNDDDGRDPILPSSSVPTAHVQPANEDAETKVPTSGSLHLFSNIELPIGNSSITYICAKCNACSEGQISDYIVEELSLTDIDDTSSESVTLLGDSDCVVEEIEFDFATESVISASPISDQTSSNTALTDITPPSSPSLDMPMPCTPLRTPDRLYSESYATETHTRDLLNRRMAHPYRRPQSLRTTQADGSSKSCLPPSAQHSKGKSLDCVVVARDSCIFPTLGNTESHPDTRIPLEIKRTKDKPRSPDRIYTEIYPPSSQSRPPRTRKTNPHRRPRSPRTTDGSLENLSHQNIQRLASSALKSSQTPPPKAADIIKPNNYPVVPGAYAGRELEEFESVYLNRPPFATFSPRYWRSFSQWVLELLCGW